MTKKNKPLKITLAHINDTHSYFEPHSLKLDLTVEGKAISPYVSNGGFARIATRSKQLKAEANAKGRDFLFFHAGDCFQGTLYFSLFKGRANADLLNALKIDAMALGNHELDMGNQPVADFLDRINFPILAGNWDISAECKNKKNPLLGKDNLLSYNSEEKRATWKIYQLQGEPLAVFGVSMDQMADIANPDPDTPFTDTFRTVQSTVDELKRRGINKIVLLSHLGFDIDLQLAEMVDGLALIIGGHSHTLQGDFSAIGMGNNGEYGIDINGTRVVQSGLYAQAIGHCEIDFNADGSIDRFSGRNELLVGRRLCIDASLSTTNTDSLHQQALDYLRNEPQVVICKRDPDVHNILENKYIPRVRVLQETIIGHARNPLRHVRVPDKVGGSDIVPLVAESFYTAMRTLGHDVQFAIHNAGGVRASINSGPISVADIAGKLLPFAVPIGVYRIKGKFLALAIEGAINNAINNGFIGTGSGSYPYTHNLRFDYDKEENVGSRLINLMINKDNFGWCAIEPDEIYMGTSSAYTMKGKEGYSDIVNMEDNGIVTQLSMADCFIELLKSQPDKLSN
jgi:5'-nucleotidase